MNNTGGLDTPTPNGSVRKSITIGPNATRKLKNPTLESASSELLKTIRETIPKILELERESGMLIEINILYPMNFPVDEINALQYVTLGIFGDHGFPNREGIFLIPIPLLPMFLNSTDSVTIDEAVSFGTTPIEIGSILKTNYETAVTKRNKEETKHYIDQIRKSGDMSTNFNPFVFITYVSGKKGIEMATFLLALGININYQTKNGETALTTAIKNLNLPMVDFLLKSGAETSLVNDFGDTPLTSVIPGMIHSVVDKVMVAQKSMPRNERLEYKQLVSHCRKIARGDSRVNTRISHLMVKKFNTAIKIFDLLLRYGANFDHQNRDGNTPLILSSQVGILSFVNYFIKMRVDVYSRNEKGKPALMYSKSRSIIEALRFAEGSEHNQIMKKMEEGCQLGLVNLTMHNNH